MKKLSFVGIALILSLLVVPAFQSSSVAQEEVTIEFLQWWQPEMKEGSFEQLIQDYEEANPNVNIKPLSLPFSEVRNQIMGQGVVGELPDVIGVNPPWLNTLINQDIIVPLDSYVAGSDLNTDNLSSYKSVQGKHWTFPVTSYTYPLFYNETLVEQAGLEGPPETWEEFKEYAQKLTKTDENEYGWGIALGLKAPHGVATDFANWVWGRTGNIIENGKPTLTSTPVVESLELVNELREMGVISPGSISKTHNKLVEEFAAGRLGLMFSSIAHITVIKNRNPDLNFNVAPIPTPAGYEGTGGTRVARWDVAVTSDADNKEESYKFAEWLVSPEVNKRIASNAHAFPGNVSVEPSFVQEEPIFAEAFEILQNSELKSDFVGAPQTVDLQRSLLEEIHGMWQGKQTPIETAEAAQARWEEIFSTQ